MGNVLSTYHVEEGDVAVGFRESDEIFEDVYSSQKIQHGHIEPHAAVAYWEPSGKLVIYTSTQNPSSIRAQLAELFDLPQSKVRVIVPFVGGGYGGKVHPRLEPLVRHWRQGAPSRAVGVDAGRGILTAIVMPRW
jgi:CO/xanthine dehydrogenase Mo-binding subunit